MSSKYLTTFSDFRLPVDAPDFVTPEAYVEYLDDYVKAFKLGSLIECRVRVVGVIRGPGGSGHLVRISKPDDRGFSWDCDAVAVCSGLNVNPNMPDIPGIERVPKVLHSSEFKGRVEFGTYTDVVG